MNILGMLAVVSFLAMVVGLALARFYFKLPARLQGLSFRLYYYGGAVLLVTLFAIIVTKA